MSAHGNAKMVNNGTINVGTEGTTQTNMVGMQLESDAKADAVIENNGTINIYASNSYAFSQLGSNGHIVNNGTVYIDSSVSGSGFIKQDGKPSRVAVKTATGRKRTMLISPPRPYQQLMTVWLRPMPRIHHLPLRI